MAGLEAFVDLYRVSTCPNVKLGCLVPFFSLNFARTKFRDFRDFEKTAKFNTRELIMKFKLLFYYCFANMSQFHVLQFFV